METFVIHKMSLRNEKLTCAKSHVCLVCNKRFASANTLSKHRRSIHNVYLHKPKFLREQEEKEQRQTGPAENEDEQSFSIRREALKQNNIKCPICTTDVSFPKRKGFRLHLQSVHDVENITRVEKCSFNSYEEFLNWKSEEERKERVKFTLHLKNVRRQYFFCNRSGKYTGSTVSERKRLPKAHGIAKIGHCCPASIIVYLKEKIFVEYHPTHYGHTRELEHLHISTSLKQEIADKLLHGMKPKHILQEIRFKTGTINTDLSRDDLITRKDIHNIRMSYHIPHVSSAALLDKLDVVSVRVMIANEQDRGQLNSILFYKEQGEPCAGIDDGDFMIIIMSPYQKELVKTVSMDGVCIDSTFGISNYDFQLTTLFVVDGFEEAVPVAFCISSHVTEPVISFFLKKVKEATGIISANYFMGDYCPLFYNAWCSVMGPSGAHLLCAWQVIRDWQSKSVMIKEEDSRKKVHSCLKACLYEHDKDKFVAMVNDLCYQLANNDAFEGFYDHFKESCINRIAEWAYAFRTEVKLNTNMHVENFHKQLKNIYMDSRRCKRLDKLLENLLSFLQDLLLIRLRTFYFDNHVEKIEVLPQRHEDGIKLAHTCSSSDEDLWLVPSESNPNVIYHVKRLSHSCSSMCEIICRSCIPEVCLDMFSCDCFDNVVTFNMCMHIHAVVHFEGIRSYANEKESDELCALLGEIVNEEVELVTSDLPVMNEHEEDDDGENDDTKTEQEIPELLSTLTSLTSANMKNHELMKTVKEQLEATLKLFKEQSETVDENAEKLVAANEEIGQPTYFIIRTDNPPGTVFAVKNTEILDSNTIVLNNDNTDFDHLYCSGPSI